ncbi:hypothetical protein FALCPG4_000777 [Fusarium falciforme]
MVPWLGLAWLDPSGPEPPRPAQRKKRKRGHSGSHAHVFEFFQTDPISEAAGLHLVDLALPVCQNNHLLSQRVGSLTWNNIGGSLSLFHNLHSMRDDCLLELSTTLPINSTAVPILFS